MLLYEVIETEILENVSSGTKKKLILGLNTQLIFNFETVFFIHSDQQMNISLYKNYRKIQQPDYFVSYTLYLAQTSVI